MTDGSIWKKQEDTDVTAVRLERSRLFELIEAKLRDLRLRNPSLGVLRNILTALSSAIMNSAD